MEEKFTKKTIWRGRLFFDRWVKKKKNDMLPLMSRASNHQRKRPETESVVRRRMKIGPSYLFLSLFLFLSLPLRHELSARMHVYLYGC